MAKECVLNTGKLHSGGLPRSSVVRITDHCDHQLFTVDVKQQIKQYHGEMVKCKVPSQQVPIFKWNSPKHLKHVFFHWTGHADPCI